MKRQGASALEESGVRDPPQKRQVIAWKQGIMPPVRPAAAQGAGSPSPAPPGHPSSAPTTHGIGGKRRPPLTWDDLKVARPVSGRKESGGDGGKSGDNGWKGSGARDTGSIGDQQPPAEVQESPPPADADSCTPVKKEALGTKEALGAKVARIGRTFKRVPDIIVVQEFEDEQGGGFGVIATRRLVGMVPSLPRTWRPGWCRPVTGPLMSATDIVLRHNAWVVREKRPDSEKMTVESFLDSSSENTPNVPLFGQLNPSLLYILMDSDFYAVFDMASGDYRIISEYEAIRAYGQQFPPGVRLNNTGVLLKKHKRKKKNSAEPHILSWGPDHTMVSVFTQHGDLAGYINDYNYGKNVLDNGGEGNKLMVVPVLGPVHRSFANVPENCMARLKAELGEKPLFHSTATNQVVTGSDGKPYIAPVGAVLVAVRTVSAGEFVHLSYNAIEYDQLNKSVDDLVRKRVGRS